MAKKSGNGTPTDPIELLGSDDELGYLSVVDLTLKDQSQCVCVHTKQLQAERESTRSAETSSLRNASRVHKVQVSGYKHNSSDSDLISDHAFIRAKQKSSPSITGQHESSALNPIVYNPCNKEYGSRKVTKTAGSISEQYLASKKRGTDFFGFDSQSEVIRNKKRKQLKGPTSPSGTTEAAAGTFASPQNAEIYPLIARVHRADGLHEVNAILWEDHSINVKIQLTKALSRQKSRQSCQSLLDNADLFADMAPLEEDGNRGTKSKHKAQLDPGSISNVVFKLNGMTKCVPRYKQYTSISQSFLVRDNRQIDFAPFFLGSGTEKWLQSVDSFYDKPRDPLASRWIEKTVRLKQYLPQILQIGHLNLSDILTYSANENKINNSASSCLLTEHIASFLSTFKSTFGVGLQDMLLETSVNSVISAKPAELLGMPKVIESTNNLLEPHLTSCPVCHVYACGIHGVYKSNDSEDQTKIVDTDNEYTDLNISFEGMLHRPSHSLLGNWPSCSETVRNSGGPCSPGCFLINAGREKSIHNWTSTEIAYLQTLLLGLQNEYEAACILAPLVNIPCNEVNRKICLLRTRSEVPRHEPKKQEKLSWYDNKSKKIRVDLNWGTYTLAHSHHQNNQPKGCEHQGLSCIDAGKDRCTCVKEKILCDKFCACPSYMKFTGCNCSHLGFSCFLESLACPCILLNRECDPDLCHTCGAADSANPFTRREEPPTSGCCNTDIQRGISKRLLLGESSHPGNIGLGAYLAEPVLRGAFIAEYVGEIISYAEVGRRNEAYALLETYYFFDLNAEVAIDSYRYGNLTRFINHGKRNANCKPKVNLVNGAHRIGFYALKDLAAGVELFFNYGKEFARNYELQEVTESVPRVPRKRTNRRKTPPPEPLSSPRMELLQDGHSSDEEWAAGLPETFRPILGPENEQQDSNGRPRRTVRKPIRYTR